MTVVSTDYHPDGTTSEETDVRARISGGPGLAGTWKEVSVPEGATIALKQSTSTELTWSYAVKGTVLTKGVDTVSSDGKSLASVSWAPGKESEKTTEVYDRQ
jgi:hypothetical protein